MVKQGLTPPRIGTPLTGAPNLGGPMRQTAKGLGVTLVPWQSLTVDVSTELKVGKRAKRLRAKHVGVLVPRQCGKSKWAQVRAWGQCLLPELDGVEELIGHRVGPQHVGWLCQDRAHALRAFDDAVDELMASDFAGSVKTIKRQRGDESIKFGTGSSMRVITPNRTGPRGLSLDLIVLDEALAHEAALLAALAPTQAQRDNAIGSIGAQFVVLSSEGDERSTLLSTVAELGRRSVYDGDPSRCWLEWSADPAADPYDPETWRATIPTLDRPNGISTEFVRMQSETMDVDDFRREYLCLHTPRPAQHCIDVHRWENAPRGAPIDNTLVFGIDATPSGSAAAIMVAGMADDGIAVEVIEWQPGMSWLAGAVIERALRWDAPVVYDGSGPLAWLAPELINAGVELIKLSQSDAMAAAARFSGLVDEGRICHLHDSRLAAAVSAATRRRSGDRWGFDRYIGDLSGLVAASFAAWALDTTQVGQVTVW